MQMHFLLEFAGAFHHLRRPGLRMGFWLAKRQAQLLVKPAHVFRVAGGTDSVFTFRRQAVQLGKVAGRMLVKPAAAYLLGTVIHQQVE